VSNLRRRFTTDRQGRIHPHLTPQERELLASLPEQVLELIAEADPSTRRLFPPAYPDDDVAEREYQALTGESLLDHHRHALDALSEGVAAETVDEGDLQQWMGALEVLRLVLGTKLDVTEDMGEVQPDDPRAAGLALYGYLSMLQEEVVDALSRSLPAGGS
jgi:hypothetical protein